MEKVEVANASSRRHWPWMLLYGILLIIIGVFAWMDPLATGLAVGVILAVSFMIVGVGSLLAAFTDSGWQNKSVDILFGILALLAGLISFVNPFAGAISIVWVIGLLFIVTGGFELVAGFRSGGEKMWLIILGVVDLLIGFWATFMMPPDAALIALAALVGMAFVLRGIFLSIVAFRLRGLVHA